MIKLLDSGNYKLIQTRAATKVLDLGREKVFAWIMAGEIGEILVTTHKPHKVDHVLAVGKFALYDVNNEPNLVDNIHLELEVGLNVWQGYLLLTGLPNDEKIRGRIIPTSELVGLVDGQK